jgi:predicted aminopeptidase
VDLLKSILVLLTLAQTGCYYVKSAYHQVGLLNDRVPIEKALQDPALTEDEKAKLRLSQEVMIFAEKELGLNSNGNYSSYVRLKQPYVTYVVSAAPKWDLKHHIWSFPFVGKVPYKGFFIEDDAKSEEKSLQDQGLDTYLRGVSAFSTLGWFRDPLLSSMLRYKEPDLVNTLIHETVHATLFIKSNADFNERLAVFLGNWGTELFYREREGQDSQTLSLIKQENIDEKIFAEFITKELALLEIWYESKPEQNEELRQARFKEIQSRFDTEVTPRLKTKSYDNFKSLKLSNARLLVYKTYLQDLSKFEGLAQKTGQDFRTFLEKVKLLEKHPEPEKAISEL